MILKNYVEVPATEEEDFNAEYTTRANGVCVSLDEGSHVTYFIGHKQTSELRPAANDPELMVEKNIVRAFPVRVPKPATRDAAINAAEMAAYGLYTAMDVASFNAALARKSRISQSDEEVLEHDNFIYWVREELTKIGV